MTAPSTPDLVEFLRARYAEQETPLREVVRQLDAHEASGDEGIDGGWSLWGSFGRAVDAAFQPRQLLRAVEAKQQLAAGHERTTDMWDQGEGLVDIELCRTCAYGLSCDHCFERDDLPEVGWPCRALRLFASEFADHPDYQKEAWAL